MDLIKHEKIINQLGFNSLEVQVIETYKADIISQVPQQFSLKKLKQILIRCHELLKLKVDEKAIEKDAVLLYDQIIKDNKLHSWSLSHFEQALTQGFLNKSDNELNVVSVKNCIKYIKAFAETRAKTIIKYEIKAEREQEEKQATEQIPEKKLKYLNQICNYYNSGDWKDCNDIGMRSIYFKTLHGQAETDQQKSFFKGILNESKKTTENIKEGFLKIYTKEYFEFSNALGLLFKTFEKHNRKLIVELDKIKSVAK